MPSLVNILALGRLKLMRIAIEGANNVGKSTFIKQLIRETDIKVLHTSGKPDNIYYNDLMLEDNIIFDRFCIGDRVYNDPNLLTDEEIKSYVSSLNKLIVLETDIVTMQRGYRAKNEPLPERSELLKEKVSFVKYLIKNKISFTLVTRTKDNHYIGNDYEGKTGKFSDTSYDIVDLSSLNDKVK